jgi:DNA sulfur modification protein DndB
MAKVSRLVALKSNAFRDLVEMERSSLSARSRKLFTLSAIHSGNTALLDDQEIDGIENAAAYCGEYWDAVGEKIPEWRFVRESKMSAGDVRRDFLHSHAIMLQALGIVGYSLRRDYPNDWKRRLAKLKGIDWARSNAKLWEGRALIGGHVSKARHNVTLAANAIKSKLGLELCPEETRVEDAFVRGDRG